LFSAADINIFKHTLLMFCGVMFTQQPLYLCQYSQP